ncbi:MAG: DEAD/DEAH box helicase [Corynebacterium sp.]|uniref:DEAD/DEAH box helicase n=1 Tax=Corynebacterium TaxID=1716 RepID=UPI00264A0804|nr:DEAD/DEAH box helicase [Corynebacterium sp.]MDN5721899.1 DEAD/DEAH box helicase [Corynebacterium sp.]MDN6281866.1 DEAD/DEAH box helicase [Corynebacterium sp.]MDN6305078.1 DEAD/DEAH box helicase [Corynebacterium sp.]MDN6351724.1 DEAD/DEAH box helicase [Corynebacterium sp.]MDN6367254.1 DEAD/DEAH box helicase [Corynebacterium sp.]
MSFKNSRIGASTAHGFLDRAVDSEQVYHPRLIANRDGNTMVHAIEDELRRSIGFDFSVAFITPGALGMLKQSLRDFTGRATIITSTYLDFNEPDMFRELLTLDGIEVLVHPGDQGGFHSKGYVFTQDGTLSAIVGSSNLTRSALTKNQEWNLRFSALPEGDITYQLQAAIEDQKAHAFPLTTEWIDEYSKRRKPKYSQAMAEAIEEGEVPAGRIVPNAMQKEALDEIRAVREGIGDEAGADRALVISATGTGKTILAALAAREINPERMLFVVHREQILNKAITEFCRVLEFSDTDVGRVVGAEKDLEKRCVFAMVQTLSKTDVLQSIPRDAFDLIIIDEVHRAGAKSYERLIEHFSPCFLLGLTATPERTDDINVFELFHHNVPYEIRLQEALEADMLTPFDYYGVTEYIDEVGDANEDASLFSKLVAPERVDHILDKLRSYGFPSGVKGLIFCSSLDEATELTALLNERELNGRRLRTVALTGNSSSEEREHAMKDLAAGELDYILTRDIFNEGIDIPEVNQVVMLRNTESSIIFTQQLGRGLRKSLGKDHLRVIDFIGNYKNNFLIPIALFGDNSLNKETIREKLIKAESAGVIAGLSSVNFDEISRKRVLQSLATSSLDSIHNLKSAFRELKNRIGTVPMLADFARHGTVDPVVLAAKRKCYWSLLPSFDKEVAKPTAAQEAYLAMLDHELVNGKRPHELLLIDVLLEKRTITRDSFAESLVKQGCVADDDTLDSVERILTLEFFTKEESKKYGPHPVIDIIEGTYRLNPNFARLYEADDLFTAHVDDAVEAGLYLARHKGTWSGHLEYGKQYTRKDVCRLLNFESNQYSTLYGYKTDEFSNSCPIFITYEKSDEISATTQYEDGFDDESTVNWFTKSRTSLKSKREYDISTNVYPLHVFVKKDDVDGSDFYYLGGAVARDARDTHIKDKHGKDVSIVNMKLDLESPVDLGLYGYLTVPSMKD